MSGAKSFLCIRCGEVFKWGVAYSHHMDECPEDYKVELIAQYGRVTVNSNDCWIWGRKLNKEGGYATSGKFGYMHRLMHVVSTGDADIAEYDICHRCDTPPCVNPTHLFKGTRQTNMLDGVTRNGHWTSKLSEEELEQWKQSITTGRQLQAAALRAQARGGEA